MSAPHDLDDGWAELARELGLEGDRPFPAAEPDHPAADLHPPEVPAPETDDEEFVETPVDLPVEAEIYAAPDADADAESDELEGEDGEEVEGEGEPTGEPGEPKKKRRRRRRRKKRPADGTTAPAVEGEAPDGAEEPEDSEQVEEPVPDDTLVEEEGATPAATRELIANWDVPSWETIVNTMLFRPTGR